MAKKIYDIKPPKFKEKEEKVLLDFLGQTGESAKPRAKKKKEAPKVVEAVKSDNNTRKNIKRRSIWFPISAVVAVILFTIGGYLFFKLPKADVAIWPKIETLTFEQTITANKLVSSVDIINNTIPALFFEAEKTNSQDFPATGSASDGGKASGNITIYNKYDPITPFTFRSGTHFMSDSGKLFITYQKVVIPAATKSGNRITPGTVQIQVQAVEAGDSYNIAPSNFSVPGLKGTSYYYGVYATSSSAMSGGYTGQVKKVTSDDIQGAKDVLTKKTTADAKADLVSQVPADYILLDTAIMSSVTDASTQTRAGTVVENFNYQVTVTASALAIKKSDLEQFVKDYIVSKAPEGKIVLDSSIKSSYSANVVDVSGGKATLNLDFSSGVYQTVDENSISLSLSGKNADQIKEMINNRLGEQVFDVQVDFWPFWVFSAPNSQKAINVELRFQ